MSLCPFYVLGLHISCKMSSSHDSVLKNHLKEKEW